MTKEKQEHPEKDNIQFSCKEHGKESYFSIKKFEKHPRWGKNMIYVWFKDAERGDEKMWCRIFKGDRTKGVGILDNEPFNVIQFKLGDHIKYKTDKEGITWAV